MQKWKIAKQHVLPGVWVLIQAEQAAVPLTEVCCASYSLFGNSETHHFPFQVETFLWIEHVVNPPPISLQWCLPSLLTGAVVLAGGIHQVSFPSFFTFQHPISFKKRKKASLMFKCLLVLAIYTLLKFLSKSLERIIPVPKDSQTCKAHLSPNVISSVRLL